MKTIEIKDVPVHAIEAGFTYIYSTFIQVFSMVSEEEKIESIRSEPQPGILSNREYSILAATAHQLANKYELPVPDWVFQEKFIQPFPCYPRDTKNERYQKILRETTPEEFANRNLFYGEN